MIMPFLYKDRQAKRKATSVNRVLDGPDYSKIEPIPELWGKVRKESNKRSGLSFLKTSNPYFFDKQVSRGAN